MHSADPTVRHPEHQPAVPDTVAVAQHVMVAVNRMPVDLHIQDRSPVKFFTDPSGRCGIRPAHFITGEAVFPQTSSDHERREEVGGPSEQFEKIGVQIDQAPAADPRDPSKDILRLLSNSPAFVSGQSIDQVRDRCRTAVPSVRMVELRKLSGRKAVFISFPANAAAPCIQ